MHTLKALLVVVSVALSVNTLATHLHDEGAGSHEQVESVLVQPIACYRCTTQGSCVLLLFDFSSACLSFTPQTVRGTSTRSEQRRVGKGGVKTVSAGW